MNRNSKIWGAPRILEFNGLRGFYLILFYYFGRDWQDVVRNVGRLEYTDWLWPWDLAPFQHTPEFIFAFQAFAMLSFMLAVLWPRYTPWRVCAGLSFFFALSYLNSFGLIGHGRHLWIYAALFFAFPYARLGAALDMSKVMVFSTYIISGLWKFRRLFNWNPPKSIGMSLPEHLAFAYAEGSMGNVVALKVLHALPVLAGLIWITVIIMQLSFIIPVLKPRFEKEFALIAMMFHVSSQLLMGIWFDGQVLLLIWLFFAMREEERPA